jgi:flagellar protein FlbD
MITLTRLHGARFALNPELIERVEATPDTVVTLVTGSRYVVAETLEEVTAAVAHQRASVLAEANRLAAGLPTPETPNAGPPAPDSRAVGAESPEPRLRLVGTDQSPGPSTREGDR